MTKPKIEHLKMTITKQKAEEDLNTLQSVLGSEEFAKKFSGLELNLDHAFPREAISTLAMLYRTAERHGLKESFIAEIQRTGSVVTVGPYGELAERYLALMIAEKEFPDISEAIPEHKVLDGLNPDWTFRTEHEPDFHLEVSAITIQKIIDDLQAFGGQIPTGQIIRAHAEPLYFEVTFPDNPRTYDGAAIGRLIAQTAKTQTLPANLTHDGLKIMVDLLSVRYQLPQLMSESLNDPQLLKSTRLMNDRLAYTLATRVSLKEISDKIDEKKKSNKLDKIGNVWLCIFVEGELESYLEYEELIKQLQLRISKSNWLQGLILVRQDHVTNGEWQLSYIRID